MKGPETDGQSMLGDIYEDWRESLENNNSCIMHPPWHFLTKLIVQQFILTNSWPFEEIKNGSEELYANWIVIQLLYPH